MKLVPHWFTYQFKLSGSIRKLRLTQPSLKDEDGSICLALYFSSSIDADDDLALSCTVHTFVLRCWVAIHGSSSLSLMIS